jgi:plastocyanin
MTFRRLLIVVVLASTAAACSSSSTPSTTPSTTPTTTTGSAVTVTIPTGAAGMTTTAFGTNPLTVAVGTTVTWVNSDSIAHTSTANAGQFNTGVINPGGSAKFQFTAAGTFAYHCSIHPGMVGTIVAQ